MSGQAASLQNLRDIAVPQPPPFWPPAPGVFVVLVIVFCVLTALFLWWRRARERSAYRRAGLTLLEGAGTAREVDVIIKRVALAVFPRPRVAPLYGDEWVAFLETTCPRAKFAPISTADPGTVASGDLRRLAGIWIRHHRVDDGGA